MKSLHTWSRSKCMLTAGFPKKIGLGSYPKSHSRLNDLITALTLDCKLDLLDTKSNQAGFLPLLTREILFNIVIVFGIPVKIVRLTKTCLNETCSRIQAGKHFSDNFPIKSGMK